MPRRFRQRVVAAVSGKLRLALSLACLHSLHVHAQTRTQAADEAPQPVGRDESEARRTTIARAIFEDGLRFIDAGKWADARDRFERVLELRYSAVAAYNLGLAQARLGKRVVASATLRKVLSDPQLEPKVRDPATALLAEVEAKFGWLTLHVVGTCDECSVNVDADDWPAAAWGVAVPIDPGNHALELRLHSRLLAIDHVAIEPAARVEAKLFVPGLSSSAPGGADANRSASVAPRAATEASPSLLTSPWLWGAVGVLVAGTVTAVILATR